MSDTDTAWSEPWAQEDDEEVQSMLDRVAELSLAIKQYTPNLKERLGLYLKLRAKRVPNAVIAGRADVTPEAVRLAVHKHLSKKSKSSK